MKTVVFCLLFFSSSLSADTFNINLMGFFQTQSVYRGAQTWPRGSGLIAPGFQFFDRKLSINGPSANWSFMDKEDPFKISTGFRYYGDSKPFIKFSDAQEDYRNQRKTSLEYYVKTDFNFGWKNKFGIGLHIGREIIRYKAFYSEFSAKAPLLPFTSLVGKLSYAQGDTNRYLYGPEAISGLGYSSLGIRFVIPFVPWEGIIINSLDRSWVLKGANKAADYVRGKDDHLVFSTRWIWNAY